MSSDQRDVGSFQGRFLVVVRGKRLDSCSTEGEVLWCELDEGDASVLPSSHATSAPTEEEREGFRGEQDVEALLKGVDKIPTRESLVDGSDLCETALMPAAQLIKVNAHVQGYRKYVLANHWNPQLFAAITVPMQGEVHLLRVVNLPSVYGKLKNQAHITDIMQEEINHEEEQEAEKYVKSVAERCETAFAPFNLKVSSSVAVSTNVAKTIIEEAEQTRDGEGALSYDMIAMATHGKGVLQRLCMGNVTQHVLDTTKLPLLLVRP